MNVVGLDLSLTATGVATAGGEYVIVTPDEKVPMRARLRHASEVITTVTDCADLVVIEDLPRNARFSGVALGMIHAAFWLAISPHTPVAAVVPASLKKYATGKGGASKDEVLASAIRRLGYGGHDHNEADALWLRAMGLDHLGCPLTEMPKGQRAALTKVDWPEIVEVTR